MAVDQFRHHRLHRVFGRPSGNGRARLANPVADAGPRAHVAAAHRPSHVQPEFQRNHGGHPARCQAQCQQHHVRQDQPPPAVQKNR